MKQIGEPRSVTAANGLGHDSTAIHTTYEVEAEDAGKTRDHYLDYKHRTLMIKRSDIGRQIVVMTDGTDLTCWSLKTTE